MVCFVVNKDKADKSGEWFPHQKELVEELAKIDGMTSITASPNTKRTNVNYGRYVLRCFGGKDILQTISAQ